MQHTTNYNLNQWDAGDRITRADFNADNAAIDAALKSIADAAAGRAKIAVGSYTGTGRYGMSNKNSLTFDFEPKLVLLLRDNTELSYYDPFYVLIKDAEWSGRYVNGAFRPFYAHFNANKAAWFCQSGPEYQFNTSGVTYYYCAIG